MIAAEFPGLVGYISPVEAVLEFDGYNPFCVQTGEVPAFDRRSFYWRISSDDSDLSIALDINGVVREVQAIRLGKGDYEPAISVEPALPIVLGLPVLAVEQFEDMLADPRIATMQITNSTGIRFCFTSDELIVEFFQAAPIQAFACGRLVMGFSANGCLEQIRLRMLTEGELRFFREDFP